MNPEKYIFFTTEEIVLDKEFIYWVLHPNKESDLIWSLFLEEHPEAREKIREAAFIIRSLQPVETEFVQPGLDRVFMNLKRDILARRKKIMFSAMRYAAGLLLLISAGIITVILNRHNNSFPIAAVDAGASQKGKIILADGSYHEFDTKQTTIEQTVSGKVRINDDTILNASGGSAQKDQMNRIIIPYGERLGITLADGTRIWMNSGSQLSYPTRFKGDSREVFLEGEAFFDVKGDSRRPFYVITKDVRIKVLGTRFNVSSYADDNFSQTVLVKGKVRIDHNAFFSKAIELEPGERFTFNKSEKTMIKDKVDVQMFSSWVDGFLIFENEPIKDIFVRLERYYNQRIIADPALNKITFSGKLDLTENLKDVLYNISFASSLHVTQNGEYYIIKP